MCFFGALRRAPFEEVGIEIVNHNALILSEQDGVLEGIDVYASEIERKGIVAATDKENVVARLRGIVACAKIFEVHLGSRCLVGDVYLPLLIVSLLAEDERLYGRQFFVLRSIFVVELQNGASFHARV